MTPEQRDVLVTLRMKQESSVEACDVLREGRSARGRANQLKGRKFEARVRRYYSMPATAERLGHEPWIVIRSAGSLGVVDLIAMRAAPMYHTEVHWLACRTNGKWSLRELAEFVRAAERVRAKPMLAYREDDPGTHFRLVVVDANERLARMLPA